MMIFRAFLVISFLLLSMNGYTQTFNWKNTNKTKGVVSFEDVDINFLIVRFDSSYVGYNYATEIYMRNLDKYQRKLEEIFESSGINYTMVTRSELQDSTYSDVQKYPVSIDHEAVIASGDAVGCFLELIIRDRRTKLRVSVRFPQQSTKYTQPYKKFIRKVKKGKSMRMKMY